MQTQAQAAPVVETPNLYRSLLGEPIRFPALARPNLNQLHNQYGVREILEDTSPSGELVLDLGTVLKPDETSIDGVTYATRREPLKGLTLGLQHAEWIVANQDSLPAWFKALLGQVYIDFPGIVVLDADGRQRFPYLGKDGKRWCLVWLWTGGGLGGCGRVAVSGK